LLENSEGEKYKEGTVGQEKGSSFRSCQKDGGIGEGEKKVRT